MTKRHRGAAWTNKKGNAKLRGTYVKKSGARKFLLFGRLKNGKRVRKTFASPVAATASGWKKLSSHSTQW